MLKSTYIWEAKIFLQYRLYHKMQQLPTEHKRNFLPLPIQFYITFHFFHLLRICILFAIEEKHNVLKTEVLENGINVNIW